MGELLQFRPRATSAIEIENVRLVGMIPARARILSPDVGAISETAQSISGNGVTVYYEIDRDQDTAPSEYCAPES